MSQIEFVSDDEIEPVTSYGLTAETLYEKCVALARNLWWSWNHEVINLFRDLDPIRWRQLDHNPIALLSEFTPERLEMRAAELVLYSRINQAYRRLKEYMSEIPAWGRTNTGVLGSRPVAYFSLEFGVHESVPIYSGGLGVLSGDHIKSASALGVPLVACGLFYDQGYFKQHLDSNGYQQEEYLDTKVENLPMEPARDREGKPITVQIDTRTGTSAGQGLADARGPGEAVPAGLRRAQQQPGGPRADRPAVRRRQPHPHPPGIGGRRRRRPRADGPGHHAGRLSPQRRAQRLRHAGGDPPADEGRRHELRGRPARSGPSHGLHHAHARARRPRPLRPQPDRGAPWPAARRAGHLLRATDGPGPRRAAERARDVLHDRAGAEAFAAGQRREQPARPRHRGGCGPISGRGGRKRKSPSATSPTASTSPPGWPTR